MREIKVNKKNFYGIYTGLFVMTILCIFFLFYKNGKSFIWKKDGLTQHFNTLVYYGEYLRTIVRTLFREGRLEIPLWDHTIGYGADIITTLHYYVLGDPLNLLAVAVKPVHTEVLYAALIILRFYLAGITFSMYCFRMRKGSFPVLIGVFVYIFCGYALTAAVRHPYFMNPMIYFPLVLLGIEKIFRKERPCLFIFSIFVSAMSSFYFFYMITLLAVLYAAVRFFGIFRTDVVRQLLQQLRNFILYYLTGLFLACGIFLPVVLETISGGRMDSSTAVPVFYSLDYYVKLLTGFITPLWVGHWSVLGYSMITVLAVIMLFRSRRHGRELKIGFVILTLLLLVPAGGYVFNGFSYVSNRWVWGYSFLIAYILVSMVPRMTMFMKRHRRIGQAFLLLLVIVNIIANADLLYAYDGNGYVEQFHDANTALTKLTENGTKAVAAQEDESIYRYEENRYGQSIFYNAALQTGERSTSFYFSVANGSINEYFSELGINIPKSYCYAGVDGRMIPGLLANVKYFLVERGREQYLPYGYEQTSGSWTDEDGTTYDAWENRYALPVAYTYEQKISRTEYQKLTAVQRQQAVLQGAVVEEPEAGTMQPELTEQVLEYELEAGSGMRLENGKIITEEADTELTLHINTDTEGEYYLSMEQLTFDSPGGRTVSDIRVKAGKVGKTIYLRTPENQWYEGTHDFLINTGYREKGLKELKIVFPAAGTYRLEQMQVICQPLEMAAALVEERKTEAPDEIVFQTNEVTAEVDFSNDRILCFSLPYSEGWSAYVDGEETELHRTNTMYMSLDVKEGGHEIKLRYRTPGLQMGLLLMGMGVIMFVTVVWYSEQKRNS